MKSKTNKSSRASLGHHAYICIPTGWFFFLWKVSMKPIEIIKKTIKACGLVIQEGEDGFACQIGRLKIIASWGGGWDHVSISTWSKECPNWQQMCFVKDIFWNDDEWVVQYHPAKSDYVNRTPNCLHLWKPQNEQLPKPPHNFV